MSCLQVPLHRPLLCTQVAPLQETKGWPGLENRSRCRKAFYREIHSPLPKGPLRPGGGADPGEAEKIPQPNGARPTPVMDGATKEMELHRVGLSGLLGPGVPPALRRPLPLPCSGPRLWKGGARRALPAEPVEEPLETGSGGHAEPWAGGGGPGWALAGSRRQWVREALGVLAVRQVDGTQVLVTRASPGTLAWLPSFC